MASKLVLLGGLALKSPSAIWDAFQRLLLVGFNAKGFVKVIDVFVGLKHTLFHTLDQKI